MIFGLLRIWFVALLSIGLWVGVFFLARDFDRRLPDPPAPEPSLVRNPDGTFSELPPPTFRDRLLAWRPGLDATTAVLAGLSVLSLMGLGGGRLLVQLLLPKGKDEPKHERRGEMRRIRRPDGSELHVEISGPADGPTVILTHGWGASATEWYYLRRQLEGRYRLVAWDLPGLGLSKGPDNRDFSLEKLASDLKAVLDEVGSERAVLLGHSIGGMITLNFAKCYPEELGRRIVGLVLVHTTPTNPVHTMKNAALMRALQKPLLEPLCYLAIPAAPLIWLSTAMGYLNGSQHWSMYKDVFSKSATWGQVEFVVRYALRLWPATYARGILGMFRYDAVDALKAIPVPTLVIAAAQDKITKPEASEMIRTGVRGSKLITLAPGGHMGLISEHEEFGAAVRKFLETAFTDSVHVAKSGAGVLPMTVNS